MVGGMHGRLSVIVEEGKTRSRPRATISARLGKISEGKRSTQHATKKPQEL